MIYFKHGLGLNSSSIAVVSKNGNLNLYQARLQKSERTTSTDN